MARPLKVLKPAKKRQAPLKAQEQEALRIQTINEEKDVNLELRGK